MLGITIGGNEYPFFDLKYIFAALLLVFIVGIKDDLIGVSPKTKLIAIVLSILIISLFTKLNYSNFHGFLNIHQLPLILGIIVTCFIGIVIINSLNLIDGIDGLSSSIAIQISTVLGIWFILVEQFDYALLAFALSGACLAFFIFNVFGNNHKLFMGDTGSLLIGTILFVLGAKFNQYSAIHTGNFEINAAPAVLIGLFAYPLFDVLRVFLLRIFIMRKSPFKPDKNHIHHRLLALGLNHLQATLVISATNTLFIISSFVLQQYLNVFELTMCILSAAILLSLGLELMILFLHKIQPDDQFQQLFLPRNFTKSVYNKN